MKKTEELRNKSAAEIKNLIEEQRNKLARLKIELSVDKLKNTSLLRKEKRKLAQALTILKEKGGD
jgi:ribosomal protein L29